MSDKKREPLKPTESKVQGLLKAGREHFHAVTASLDEQLSKLSLNGDPTSKRRSEDGHRASEDGSRKSLEDKIQRGRDRKPRPFSIGSKDSKEKAPDGLAALALQGTLNITRAFAIPTTTTDNKKEEKISAEKEEEKPEEKPEESETDICLSPDTLDGSDDAAPHRGRSRGRKSQVGPYPSTSRAPSRLPTTDWHPTEEPMPSEEDRRDFDAGMEGLDKDHQSIVIHYGGNTFWTRRLVLERILAYYEAKKEWPMIVVRTGTSRANEGVQHAECAICGRGRDNQKQKVQHIAKHLTSDEWKIKPWRCMLCSTAYSYNDGSLKTHMKRVHKLEDPDTHVKKEEAPPPTPTLLAPGNSVASTSTGAPGVWRRSNEYPSGQYITQASPVYSTPTNNPSPALMTPSPGVHHQSLAKSPGIIDPTTLVKSPPPGPFYSGQQGIPYVTPLSMAAKVQEVLPTLPPGAGATPLGSVFPPNQELAVGYTSVSQTTQYPPLPHQLGISQAVAISANAGTAIAPNPTRDRRSASTTSIGSYRGAPLSAAAVPYPYQPSYQPTIGANQIPVGSLAVPTYPGYSIAGFTTTPQSTGSSDPQLVDVESANRPFRYSTGSASSRSTQTSSGYINSPTDAP
ncbi:hypothetical protein FRC17_009433, partial [Serendipita sp. 399]